MAELTLPAVTASLEQVLAFVNEHLEQNNCPMKARMQIDLAVEEIYVNIASYAYHPACGPVTIRIETGGNPANVTVRLIDHGIPYNPLEKTDPNTSLPAGERDPGGLGIYLVKKTVDDIYYNYQHGKNILTFKKRIE